MNPISPIILTPWSHHSLLPNLELAPTTDPSLSASLLESREDRARPIGKTLFLQLLSGLPVLATVSPMEHEERTQLLRSQEPKASCSSHTSSLRVWTIQRVEVLAQLTTARVLYAAPACVPKESLRAYIWMCAQMRQRLPHYDGHYPWWG